MGDFLLPFQAHCGIRVPFKILLLNPLCHNNGLPIALFKKSNSVCFYTFNYFLALFFCLFFEQMHLWKNNRKRVERFDESSHVNFSVPISRTRQTQTGALPCEPSILRLLNRFLTGV